MGGHGAEEDYLGLGMLYYAITYVLKAELCVCLGSGGGFVPRCMRQAQRDLGIGRTILVDVGNGAWGRTTVHDVNSWFRLNFPDVEVWKMLTAEAALMIKHADYIHTDADHSFEGVKTDFMAYSQILEPDGIITLHDTHIQGVRSFVDELSTHSEWQVLELPM